MQGSGTNIILNIVVDLDMCLKVLYFCLIISSLTLGQDNPCARALGEKDPCAKDPRLDVSCPPGLNKRICRRRRLRRINEEKIRSDNDGMNCDTCKVFGEIEKRLQSEMMQIKTQLANMNNDYNSNPDTTYYND